METKFDRNRTWGVEIEFKGSSHLVASIMNDLGVTCRAEGYNHETKSHWKIVTDASAEYELVSPPLSGDEGFRQLEIACKALKNAGARVDKTCGLHVHHNARDFSMNDFRNLFCLYYRYESTIDEMMPLSRRRSNNTYCGTMRTTNIENIKNARSVTDIEDLFYSRYHKLNIKSYVKHGTVEFRQHAGTIDFDKIQNWIIMTNLMVVKSKTSVVKKVFIEAQDTWSSFKGMMNITTSKGADAEVYSMTKFYEKRRRELARGVN